MNDVASIINGQNGIVFLVFTAIVLVVAAILVKKGILSFNGKGLRIGQDVQTRNLIQSQFEYANAKIEGTISSLPPHLDIYHTKYVMARVEDVIQRAIIFNNMTKNTSYIKAKQELVYQTVMKRITDDYFKTDEFKKMIYEFVEKLITELVDMKYAM